MKEKFYCRGAVKEEHNVILDVIRDAFRLSGTKGIDNAFKIKLTDYSDCRLVIYKKTDGSEEIVGAGPIFRYKCRYGSNILKSGGLFWYGIRREYHRQGLGQLLLEDCGNHLKSIGYELNMLFTGSYDFYRHKGYEMGVLSPLSSIKANRIPEPPIDTQKNSKIIVRTFKKSDVPELNRIYLEFNKTKPLTFIRTVPYWERIYNLWGERMEKQIDTIEVKTDEEEKIIGYVWSQMRKNTFNVNEYAIDPTLNDSVKDLVEKHILNHVKNKVIAHEREVIHFKLFDTFPLIKRILNLGGRSEPALWSSQMVKILDLQAFIRKMIAFQQDHIIPKIKPEKIKKLKEIPYLLELQCEKTSIFYLFSFNGVKVLSKRPENSYIKKRVDVPRKTLGVMALLNFTPKNLVESEYWSCDTLVIPYLELMFPVIKSLVYGLDKF